MDLRDREGMVDSQGMKDILQDTQDIRDIPYRHHLHCDHLSMDCVNNVDCVPGNFQQVGVQDVQDGRMVSLGGQGVQ